MIGNVTIKAIAEQVENLLNIYKNDLNAADLLLDSNQKLKISFTTSILNEDGLNVVDTKISFVKERVTDSIKDAYEEGDIDTTEDKEQSGKGKHLKRVG